MRTPRDSRSFNPLKDCYHTTCTAVATDAVLIVRMRRQATYGPRLVRNFSTHKLQTSSSAPCDSGHSQIVAQVRS